LPSKCKLTMISDTRHSKLFFSWSLAVLTHICQYQSLSANDKFSTSCARLDGQLEPDSESLLQVRQQRMAYGAAEIRDDMTVNRNGQSIDKLASLPTAVPSAALATPNETSPVSPEGARLTVDAAKTVLAQPESARPFDAAGRTVVVTGGSKGIGKGIASVFAKAGARVLINSRHFAEAQETADLIVAAGGVASAFEGDVSVEADMLELVKVAAERYGGIDVLVANAGIYPPKLLEKMELEDWNQLMDANLRGTFLSTKAAIPYLKQSPFGRIILTSSITGPITGFPGFTHYGATKAGQLGFMRSASVELAKYNITVNAIMPGNVLVDSLADLGPEYITKTEAVIPLQRFGTVEEMGYACLFLASKEAAFMTGQTIVLDGGQTLVENPTFKDEWEQILQMQ